MWCEQDSNMLIVCVLRKVIYTVRQQNLERNIQLLWEDSSFQTPDKPDPENNAQLRKWNSTQRAEYKRKNRVQDGELGTEMEFFRKHTLSLGFLGIISRVLRLEVSTLVFWLSTRCYSWTNFIDRLFCINFWNHRGSMVFCQIFLLCLHQ